MFDDQRNQSFKKMQGIDVALIQRYSLKSTETFKKAGS